MTDLVDVVTIPIKKIVNLIFSLSVGTTNLGSIIITGMLFAVLIGAIMHVSGKGVTRFIERIGKKKNE